MIINNNNINGYGHSSSLNTEMNDSLKNLHHSQSNGHNTRTGIVISESVLSHTNSLSINIKQANEQIIITQTATVSISLQSNILNQVNDKMSLIKQGLPNIDSAFNIAKEIQKLLFDFDAIAASSNHNGETMLQTSSSDKAKHQNLIFQLSSFVINSREEYKEEELVASNLSSMGISNGELEKLKGDDQNPSEMIRLIEQIISYEGSNNIEKSWNAKKEFDGYIDIKQSFIDQGLEQLEKLKNFFQEAQNGISTLVRQMTDEDKHDLQNGMKNIDFAKESTDFDKSNIISIAGSFSLSQANYVTKKSMNLI